MILIAFCALTLLGHDLSIVAKLVPRIIIHSSIVKKSKVIDIAIVHSRFNEHYAYKLKNKLANDTYDFNWRINCLDIEKKNFSLDGYESVYVLDIEENDFGLLIKEVRENRVITFSDRLKYLDKGVMFAIKQNRKVSIHINLDEADAMDIGFDPSALKYMKKYYAEK